MKWLYHLVFQFIFITHTLTLDTYYICIYIRHLYDELFWMKVDKYDYLYMWISIFICKQVINQPLRNTAKYILFKIETKNIFRIIVCIMSAILVRVNSLWPGEVM